jgi:hypothetical protein
MLSKGLASSGVFAEHAETFRAGVAISYTIHQSVK